MLAHLGSKVVKIIDAGVVRHVGETPAVPSLEPEPFDADDVSEKTATRREAAAEWPVQPLSRKAGGGGEQPVSCPVRVPDHAREWIEIHQARTPQTVRLD